MRMQKMVDEKCLQCGYHEITTEVSKMFPVVLNKFARWVIGVHCCHHRLYKYPSVIPSTRGLDCKFFAEVK